MKILTLLDNTKFSATADVNILQAVINLIFIENKEILTKGSKSREQINEIIAGKLALDSAAYAKSSQMGELVQFIQGLLILAVSLVNGIGRSPLNIAGSSGNSIKIKILNRSQPINITAGKYDAEMGKLVREFKNYFYGKAIDEVISKNDLELIKEALQETRRRLKNEKLFIDKMARDPEQVFSNKAQGSEFAARLFLVLSALPAEQLNTLMINIGSYLPEELQEVNEDMYKVGVRAYFTTAAQDMHELFKKIRLLLKLYFGKQREIIAIIVKEKTKQIFKEILSNKNVRNELVVNLQNAAESQFALRMKLIDNILTII